MVSQLREALAALEHKQWVHWADHMIHNCTTPHVIAHWKQLIQTDYDSLSDEQKDSDREWADRVFEILNEAGVIYEEASMAIDKDTLWVASDRRVDDGAEVMVIVSHCPHCAAPVYAANYWVGEGPPPVQHTCECRNYRPLRDWLPQSAISEPKYRYDPSDPNEVPHGYEEAMCNYLENQAVSRYGESSVFTPTTEEAPCP